MVTIMPNNINVCNSQLKTIKDKFIWNIDYFRDRNFKTGKHLESGIFTSSSPSGNPLKWRLEIYPNGRNEEAKDYISIFIYLIDSFEKEVLAKLKFCIRDSKGVDKHEGSGNVYDSFIKNGIGWGFFKFIEREELLKKDNGFLPNGQLTIVCQVTVYGEKMVEYGQNAATHFQIPECRALEDMSNLFDKSMLTDFTLVASSDGKEFKVHKCILASRSPVFAAMFQHKMTGPKKGVVKINEIETAVLEQTIRFIYSGKAPKLAEMPEELLEAADKYQLDRLKVFCERELANSIENANVCKLLVLADRYSAKNLEACVIKFVKENANEVLESDGWKKLKADHGHLIDLLLKAIAGSK